jgi:hypothetical protein
MIPIFSVFLFLPSGASRNSVCSERNAERVRLQTAFLNELRPNRRDVRLGIAQRGGRCVDRVGAEDEIVLVRDGRAENEFSVERNERA